MIYFAKSVKDKKKKANLEERWPIHVIKHYLNNTNKLNDVY